MVAAFRGYSAQIMRELDAKNEARRVAWVEGNLKKLPSRWRAAVRAKYDAYRRAGNEKGGNVYTRRLIEKLPGGLDIGALDSDIMREAKHCAHDARNYLAVDGLGERVRDLVALKGCRLPVEHDDAGIIARLSCAGWWLRQLRAAHAKACEAACIDAGLVHRRANLYVSEDTLERRISQRERNAQTLEKVKMSNDAGEVITLKQAAEAGMANPKNRASELITRVKGFEEYAKEHAHKCLFVTITTPSRFHAVLTGGKTNPKYKGEKPNEAQSYLTGQWARCRAILAKHGVRFYGLRVVEPHHDGTPHWHMALWFESEADILIYSEAVRACFLNAPICDGDEYGAKKNRVKFDALDSGSVVGYMIKYICKNLSGVDLKGDDNEALNSEPTAARVEAWAATWRIRQFQQIGGHSVSVWRELRRICESELQGLKSGDEPLRDMWEAAQKTSERLANWRFYFEAQGGHAVKMRESVAKLDDDFVIKKGQYGDAMCHEVRGVRERYGELILKNDRVKWFRV